MRKYKAVVIDLNKIKKGLITAVAATAVTLTAVGILSASDGIFSSPEKVLESANPIIGTVGDSVPFFDKVSNAAETALKLVLGFVPWDSGSVISNTLPVCGAVSHGGLVLAAEEYESSSNKINSSKSAAPEPQSAVPQNYDIGKDIPDDRRAPVKTIDAAQKSPNSIGNETSYSIDVESMLAARPDINMHSDGPKILITHTHATEAYAPNGAAFYDIKASDRSTDTAKNVVAVGDVMADVFKSHGIDVIHDTELHDEPSFNGSYAHSLAKVTEYKKQYPSIQVVFDIHRDSIVYADNTKARVAAEIDGKAASQLMFVVGTDEKGLFNPDWRMNMTAALHFQKEISQKYPKLMRHINLRRERFNGHTSHASMIIETGTSGNSLEESKYAIGLAAECIADYLNTL